MSEIAKWFERKFDLSFPAGLYPNVCARLRGTPARLEETLRGLSRESLVHKSGETWSVQENAGHLLDLEPLWLARVGDYIDGKETLTATDITNRKTHEAGHNTRNVEEILKEFRRARASLLSRAENLDAAMFTKTALHPRLKTPLRLVDHLFFVAEHDDHHLAQIWEMLRK